MTGFGKGEAEGKSWKTRVMVRSLNGKGLDISVRMPSFLLPVEQKIKGIVRSRLRRGSVFVVVDVEQKEVVPPIEPERLSRSIFVIKSLAEEAGLSPSHDVIFEYSWKYAERTITEVDEDLELTLLSALKTALEELLESRRREGEALKQDLLQRTLNIEKSLETVGERKEDILKSVKDKIYERAQKLGLGEEHPTVVNELLFLLEKMDVEEEITRLRAHINRLKKLLSSESGDIGKRIEFIAQEMHREITTLGNKIPDLSELVVEIKTEIDRIKQQAANVE